ncbi:MAG TPA: NAD(P)H-dependent oxidoreductase, partial [Streptosporangiaceae bacterium]
MSGQARILLVSGSTRSGSTNTAALRTAAEVAPSQVTAVQYDGLAELPAFNPDQDGDLLPAAAARLRRAIGESDAVLFCTPEYAG